MRVLDCNEGWSRREESNAPSAEYYSAALPLSYTGLRPPVYHRCLTLRPTVIARAGKKLTRS